MAVKLNNMLQYDSASAKAGGSRPAGEQPQLRAVLGSWGRTWRWMT